MQLANDLVVAVPIIDLLQAVWSFAASAVKPYAENIAVLGKEFAQLILEVVVILGGAVTRIMTVPWRKVYSERQATFAACIGHFLYEVALPVAPWTALDRMFSELARP
ncbi:hypothetical protein D3C78_1741030 [compost metagenome]